MDYQHILVEQEEGVAIITMNRPEVLNAMNFLLGYELHNAVMEANQDDDIGCIVITGSGERAFTAGGDIHEQREEAKGNISEARKLHGGEFPDRSFDISASPKPVVGMMNGLAYGGGAVLSSSLDFRLGCENTKFRFLAVAYGRINCTWTLTNQVGWPKAKEFLFTARTVEAEEALQVGLLNHLVPADQLRAKTMEIATLIAKNHHGSVKGIKQILIKDMTADLHGMWEIERDYTSVVKGFGVEEAFPEFIARKGRG